MLWAQKGSVQWQSIKGPVGMQTGPRQSHQRAGFVTPSNDSRPTDAILGFRHHLGGVGFTLKRDTQRNDVQ